ncbi:MAG TPA: 1-deoxy-D-xylulose-5-phosphate reductoisomerase [Candidatus Limnocylindrales bacterium]|nr:1-deoxy-D-xylulose-5-phosphate reductoisomerase [Candidatus Limnocylindrales bacterium]
MASIAGKGISILGSTGSIGTQTISLLERFPDRFRVVALAAGRRAADLKDQTLRMKPSVIAVAEASDAVELERALGSEMGAAAPRVFSGREGLLQVATAPGTDVLVSALVGAAGLVPTLAAIDAGIDIALANKEVMVVAGELVQRRARTSGSRLLPVDSEHNAVFQALAGRERSHVRKIVLTASGGPFRQHTADQLRSVTRAEALRHPTWNMGDKITIDSASLMNKGLEVIEARWLFDVVPEDIEVLVHPQSIVHALVRYHDESVIAVLALPDMAIPIAYALAWPDVLELGHLPRLDLATTGTLTFAAPDLERFPCLGLAYRALAAGGAMPAVLNAANEVAVSRFLAGDIGFPDIAASVASSMDGFESGDCDSIDALLSADAWARKAAAGWCPVRAAS